MGRKSSRITGISRVAVEMLKESSQHLTATSDEAPPSVDSIATQREITTPDPKKNTGRPVKRRKISAAESTSTAGREDRYDATGLVSRYTNVHEVPGHLQKYFSQRKRFFSLYDQGCLLDEVGWYSVTPERIANQIAERCRCDTVLDAFCGVGGNSIAFARTCVQVIALDTSPTRLALARHNAAIYGVADRIEFILTDYLSFARSFLSIPSQRQSRKIDVVFLSPPWGGPSYMFGPDVAELAAPSLPDSQASEHPTSTQGSEFSLASIQPIHGAELFKLSRQITPNISYYLPRNTSLEEISKLVEEENAGPLTLEGTTKEGYEDKSTSEMVEVEEEWMGLKLKALTCYFGGLVAGQEDLF